MDTAAAAGVGALHNPIPIAYPNSCMRSAEESDANSHQRKVDDPIAIGTRSTAAEQLTAPVIVPMDVLVLLAQRSNFKMLAVWRQTCRIMFTVVAALLRNRYEDCLSPFIDDIPAFDFIVDRLGAVVSGSVALRFFLPDEMWSPGDMDIYVPDLTYDQFIAAVTDMYGLRFTPIPRKKRLTDRSDAARDEEAGHPAEGGGGTPLAGGGGHPPAGSGGLPMAGASGHPIAGADGRLTAAGVASPTVSADALLSTGGGGHPTHGGEGPPAGDDMDVDALPPGDAFLPPSMSADVIEVRQFITRTGKRVDVIRAPGNNPTVAINRFWSSLVMNFLRPDVCVSGYPSTTLARVGMLKPDLTTRDRKAVRKYEEREFVLVTERWKEGVEYWDALFFGQPKVLVIPFRFKLDDDYPELPIASTDRGWMVNSAWPFAVVNR